MQNTPQELPTTDTHTPGFINRQDLTVFMLRDVPGGRKGLKENIWYAVVQGKADEAELEANAERLAACWNFCQDITTKKMENISIAEFLSREAYLAGFSLSDEGASGGLNGIGVQILAASFAGQFKPNGAINYREIHLSHPETGPLCVTIQRLEGQTPGQQLASLRADHAKLQPDHDATLLEVETLRSQLNALTQERQHKTDM